MGMCMDCQTDITGREHAIADCERIDRLSRELGRAESQLDELHKGGYPAWAYPNGTCSCRQAQCVCSDPMPPINEEHATLQAERDELRAEVERLKRGYAADQFDSEPCPGCLYDYGVFIKSCALHAEIARLNAIVMSTAPERVREAEEMGQAAVMLAKTVHDYRLVHDSHSAGHVNTGIAWDRMRRAEEAVFAIDKARGET